MNASAAEPIVSVIMANCNGAAHIAAAVRSVLRQTERRLELVLSDDGSRDDSLALARAAAKGDPRLVILTHPQQSGPAAARNRALAAARGRWIAIVDNDDLIHPERLARLIAQAEADGADIVADDLLTFYEDMAKAPHPHLGARHPAWIDAATYLNTNHLFSGAPSLGYLKPMFRRALSARYDEALTIAEDFDLVMRLLIGGARMRVYPELGYFYRKHERSISHRLSAASLDAMLAAHDRLGGGDTPELRQALAARRRSLSAARGFTDLIAALKARRFGQAVGIALSQPAAAGLLRVPLLDRLRHPPAPRRAEGPPRIALLSRQRIVGATNGSSAYVLAIAAALKDAGYSVDFIGASPKLFGRWPLMRLRPETSAFASIQIHGGIRLGAFILATDPRVAVKAAVSILGRALARIGLRTAGWDRPAPFAQGAAATRADQLFVARAVRPNTRAILCDYAFLTPLAPYALAAAPVLTIMHDLMSARVGHAREQAPAEVLALTPAREFALLGQSDAVLAIQAEEATAVRAALPNTAVILAPHATPCVARAQPGADDTALFVGSNTAPNIVGIMRFFAESWPLVRALRPNARLLVAGSAARALTAIPEGVTLLGIVPDLAPLYRDAGVVISPLHTGSGLKIKLVEAMAAGKAIVGTSITVQGVAELTVGALAVEDDPARFAEALAHLLGAPERRTALGAAALDVARAHFSPEAAFAPLLAYLRPERTAAPTGLPLRTALSQ